MGDQCRLLAASPLISIRSVELFASPSRQPPWFLQAAGIVPTDLDWSGRNHVDVYSRMMRLCSRAGIPDFRFHDMRHTFATRLVQRGVDLYKVQRLLGHKTSLMTQRYAHHSPESLREGVNVLDKPQPQRVSTKLAQGPVLNGLARASTLASH